MATKNPSKIGIPIQPFSFIGEAEEGEYEGARFVPAAAKGKEALTEPPSMMARLKRGFGSTTNAAAIGVAGQGDIAGLVASEAANQLPSSPAAQQMQAEIAPYVNEANNADGLSAVGAYATLAAKRIGQFISNPREFVGMVAENLPNSIPGTAGTIAGGMAGTATAGPVGGLVGSVIGGTAGGYLIEQGSAMRDQIMKEAQARGIDPRNPDALAPIIAEKYGQFLTAARLKGIGTAGTDAILNRLTLGVAGAGEKAIVKGAGATEQALKAGAISAEQATTRMSDLAAKQAARSTLGRTVARGAGVTGMEMAGEGLSEAAGQALAYGKVDAGDVVDESLLGLGQGGAMALTHGMYDKAIGVHAAGDGEAAIGRLGDAIRATKMPEGGPMTRAANAATEVQARAADSGMPAPPVMTAEQEAKALSSIEAQGASDQKAQRKFGGQPTMAGIAAQAQSQQPADVGSAEVVDSPFSDRVLMLREQLADEGTRAQLRAQFGDEALSQATYYAGIADRADVQMPPATRERLLQVAERMVSDAVLKPIMPPAGLQNTGGAAPAELASPAGVAPQIGLDTSLTGTMRADARGNVAPETNADAIDTRQAADAARQPKDERQARKASAVNAEPNPAPAAPLAIGHDNKPTGVMRAGPGGVQPETGADRANTRQAKAAIDAEAQRNADIGLTPDVRAAQERRNAPRAQAGDVLNPKGEPFKTELAASRAQKKAGAGAVLQVAGGWVVRPDATTVEPSNAQDQAALVPPPAAPAPIQEGADSASPGTPAAPAAGAAGPTGAAAPAVEGDGLKDGDAVQVLNGKGEPKQAGTYRGKNDSGTGSKVELASGEVVTVVADRVRKANAEPADVPAPAPEKAADRRNRLKAERAAPAPAPAAPPKQTFAEMTQEALDSVPGYKGKNTDGEILYEDKRGVRSILRDGVRVAESVSMRPTRDGVKLAVEHRGEFMTAEEAAAAQAQRVESPALPPSPAPLADSNGPAAPAGRPAELIELRKRVSVLEALRRCVA